MPRCHQLYHIAVCCSPSQSVVVRMIVCAAGTRVPLHVYIYVYVHIYMHMCVYVINIHHRTQCADRQQLVHRQPAPDPMHRVDAGEAG